MGWAGLGWAGAGAALVTHYAWFTQRARAREALVPELQGLHMGDAHTWGALLTPRVHTL